MASMRTKKRRHYQRMGYRIANPPMVSDQEAIPSPLYAVLRSHLPHALALWAEALLAVARKITDDMEQIKQARTGLRD